MPTKPMTLKPGLLVSLRTRLTGGVKYERNDLAVDKTYVAVEEDGMPNANVAKWETTRIIDDVDEHNQAVKVRSKCSSLIRSACTYSEFGLLCPKDKEALLDAAIDEAKRLTEDGNLVWKKSRVYVYALKARIAETDAEAARAIGSELRELLEEMQVGITEMSVERVREAANKAKKLTVMLDETTGKAVNSAVDEARGVARELLKRLTKSPDEAASYVRTVNLRDLAAAQNAFIDLEGPRVRKPGDGSGSAAPAEAVGEIDLGEPTEMAASGERGL